MKDHALLGWVRIEGADGNSVGATNPLPVALSGSSAVLHTATIASAASLSDAVDLAGKTLVGIAMPAAWTAANLTFQVSADGVTYYDLADIDGVEVIIAASASKVIQVPYAKWLGVRYLKVRSGGSAAAVAQATEREITLLAVP